MDADGSGRTSQVTVVVVGRGGEFLRSGGARETSRQRRFFLAGAEGHFFWRSTEGTFGTGTVLCRCCIPSKARAETGNRAQMISI